LAYELGKGEGAIRGVLFSPQPQTHRAVPERCGAFLFIHKHTGRFQGKEGKAHEPDKGEVYFKYIELLVRQSATQPSFSWNRPSFSWGRPYASPVISRSDGTKTKVSIWKMRCR
jgi:hypothetical protein